MNPNPSITSEQEYFQRQIEEFNAEQWWRWRLRQRRARRRRRNEDSESARPTFPDTLSDWRKETRIRWFGPSRWIHPHSKRP